MKRAPIALSCLLIALFSACGSDQGPKTHDYLVSVVATIDQSETELAKLSPPKPPTVPANIKVTEANVASLRRLRDELLKFFPTLAKPVSQVSAIVDDAQTKAGAWNPTDVDPLASDLASKLRLLLDHRQQLAVQLSGLIAEQKNEVQAGRMSNAGMQLLATCTDAVFSPADAASVPNDITPSGEKAQGKEVAAVERSLAAWRKDAASAASAKEGLMSALKAKYPQQDWGFLAVKK